MASATFRNDPMFLRNQFEGDGVFELPIIRRESVALEEIALTGYDRLSSGETDKIVHFFLDDYKFNRAENRAVEALSRRFIPGLQPVYGDAPCGAAVQHLSEPLVRRIPAIERDLRHPNGRLGAARLLLVLL